MKRIFREDAEDIGDFVLTTSSRGYNKSFGSWGGEQGDGGKHPAI